MRLPVAVLMSAVMVATAAAQGVETEWRESVTGQILALRNGDGAAALGFAGAAFRATYKGDPQKFTADIARSGYGPIAESRSHTFGSFREVATGAVLQEVEFIGSDGRVWEAVYQMADEPDEGWRVQGVILRSTSGLGI